MSESVTISRKTPVSKSLQYDFLREEAIACIQRLAGKIWTDYNIHDPGITILEVLCYAITELGYRASFDIAELLAARPGEEHAEAGRQFFTAREILPNCPVTINDYRKLLIDVDIYSASDASCPHVGVKNAWIEPSSSSEIPVYVHPRQSRLDYAPDPQYVPVAKKTAQPSLALGILYDILLEFETCDAYGDLNENNIAGTLTLDNQPDTALNGLLISVSADFPRWDSEAIDWDDDASIRSGIGKIILQFLNVPDQYEFSYEISNGAVRLTGLKITASDTVEVEGVAEIENRVNDFLYSGPSSLLALYRRKIARIFEIIAAVRRRLHSNRNLCEDFYRLRALRVEKIAVCADIELEREADVEEVQARMYHEIAKFLSPQVFFYTLEEMLDKGRESHSLAIFAIDTAKPCFSVGKNLEELLAKGDKVVVSQSGSNDGEYTVESIAVDAGSSTTRVYVMESLASELLSGKELLTFETISQEACLTVDEIFEGPALEHGFIDNRELSAADRKKYIHVSDLIRIIMGIEGVVAVSSIQVANIPQDNADGKIPSKSVKWCLSLAYEQNYVPRLSVDDSKITFYKDRLPFKASPTVVDALIEALEMSGRKPKLFDPLLDFAVPSGRYRDLEQYASIQNDFPATYGIGEEGLASSGSDEAAKIAREAKTRQLKGFLMHFDQLLANYFSQLAHVRELFSMQAEKDRFGRYIINRTYFTQPLFDIVPGADKLYVDKAGHAVALNGLAEDEALFHERKNRFLDHLVGRFAENFTDYAMLTYKLSGKQKAPEELIEDKLAFLNAYPAISSQRGKGFDYQDSCKPWHLENCSGLRQRVSFLAGISEPEADELHFSSQFSITPSGDGYVVQVFSSAPELLLGSEDVFSSADEARLALERMITSGIGKENYTARKTGGASGYHFTLDCREVGQLGVSARTDYPDNLEGGELDSAINALVQLFRQEYDHNIESSRNNLACAIFNYIGYTIEADMVPDPPQAIVRYSLFSEPLRYDPDEVIVSGRCDVKGQSKSNVAIVSVDTAQSRIVIDGNIAARLRPGDVVVIDDSGSNDGVYTVLSAEDVATTTLITVGESIAADTLPLGELLFNNDTGELLLARAEAQLPEIFWELIRSASLKNRYYFTSDGGEYRFRIFDKAGNDIAESTEANFNAPLANEIASPGSGAVRISGSTGNDGEYGVDAVTLDGAALTLTLQSDLPSSVADGTISFTLSFDFTVDSENQAFLISADLTGRLFAGDTITIAGSDSNDGAYSIFSIAFDGVKTAITVEEPIPAEDDSGELSYTKSFGIDAVAPRKVIFRGGCDIRAVERFIAFITSTFFSREGFHVLEHILLRPKVRGLHFVGVDAETFAEDLANAGTLYRSATLPIFSASSATNTFRVSGNLKGVFDETGLSKRAREVRIAGTGCNDGVYAVKSLRYDSGTDRTTIEVSKGVFATIPFSSSSGTLSFMKGVPVTAVSSARTSITISDPESPAPVPGEVIEIRGSTGKRNDGRYLVGEVFVHDETFEIIISRVERFVEDRLLEIVLDEAGGDICHIDDPYTCVASVILPHWQGRFDNIDFRRFIERQLRLEAPAHVFLNICWISCRQMAEFESACRAWLAETVKEKKDYGELSARQNALVDILGRLRNVYPSGVLHDCDREATLEDAIILDNSVLGNA